MRGPASGNWIPWGPMSLGNTPNRQLCPCSCPGQPMSLGMPPVRLGCLPWQEKDRTQLDNTGTMAQEYLAREGRKLLTSPCLVHFTAGFMQMTWKSAVSSAVVASFLGSFTPGRGRGKIKTWSYNTQPGVKGPCILVRYRHILGTKYFPSPCQSPV